METFEGIDSVPVQHLSRYNHPPVERLRCTACGVMWWNDWSLDERRIRGEFGR